MFVAPKSTPTGFRPCTVNSQRVRSMTGEFLSVWEGGKYPVRLKDMPYFALVSKMEEAPIYWNEDRLNSEIVIYEGGLCFTMPVYGDSRYAATLPINYEGEDTSYDNLVKIASQIIALITVETSHELYEMDDEVIFDKVQDILRAK